MMWKKNLILRILFVSVIVSLVCVASLSATSGQVEITGVVFVPDSLDAEDVYPVVLAGEDGEMYGISINEKCAELAQHENKLVKVIGALDLDKKGRKTIAVEHYEILKE
jgi:hypothetical protein